MKKLLIISPYFPPSNMADMHRIRMSLGFFRDYGWEPEVVCVDPAHSDSKKDPLLLESIPADVPVHYVGALDKRYTSKLGLGSIALRSLPFFFRMGNKLLKQKSFDLVYFSTTQFPVCILGASWLNRFKVPYVIDMQDPWHSDYYRDKPPAERPPKYWFSYRLNKFLEPIAMRRVGGLIAVSPGYIERLQQRYPHVRDRPAAVIPFGAFETDFDIARKHSETLEKAFDRQAGCVHLVYVGRGGRDMRRALSILFGAFQDGLRDDPALFSKLRFHFIGTSYAPAGTGKPSVLPAAREYGVAHYVAEHTDRIGFYEGINALLEADALLVPGSDDPAYTPSKIYPYVQAGKPLLTILYATSPAAAFITRSGCGIQADLADIPAAARIVGDFLAAVAAQRLVPLPPDDGLLRKISANFLAEQQCALFDQLSGT